MSVTVYTYDGTFEGFLTSIFECYNRKDFPVEIVSCNGEQKYLLLKSWIFKPMKPNQSGYGKAFSKK